MIPAVAAAGGAALLALLGDGPARFKRLAPSGKESGTNRWYRAVLGGGRNREVRRLVEAVGSRVSRLIRVRFGPISLPRELPPGRSLELPPEAVAEIVWTAKIC